MANHRDPCLEATPALDATVAEHHDYVWARLPYLVPMAVKVARHCRRGGDGCAALAALVGDLRAVLLDHLDHEERILSTLERESDPAFVTQRIAALHAEHLAVGTLLERIRAAGVAPPHAAGGACAAERALHRELALLDDHVRAQILLEERLLAARFAPVYHAPDCHP
jgi:iron-sulfur cluster repair protein YtfE (RIC family)